MFKRLLGLLGALVALGVSVSLAWAQDAPSLPRVQVEIWPEYDRPSVLVIVNLTLPEDMTLPAQVQVRIPARAGEPHAVAVRQPDGTLVNAPFQRVVTGEWATVTVTASTPEVHVEYYDPALEKDGDQRRFLYEWPGDLAAEQFIVRVQQPVGAEEFTLTPSLGVASAGADGLLYYTSDLGAIAAGQPFTLEVRYRKADNRLSVEQLQVQPSAPLSEAQGRVDFGGWVPWVLGGVGVLLIVVGVVWYVVSSQAEAPAGKKRRHRGRKKAVRQPLPPEVAGEADEAARFCPQCGSRAQPGDRFCRQCGARLRE